MTLAFKCSHLDLVCQFTELLPHTIKLLTSKEGVNPNSGKLISSVSWFLSFLICVFFFRYKLLRESVTTNMHQRDGLNNLVYKVESIDKHPLFTQINISFDADKVRKAKPKTINFPYLTDIS